MATEMPSARVLGVKFHPITMSQALMQMEAWIKDRSPCRYVVATGMHGVMEAQRSAEFKTIINSADLFVPDGIALVWVAQRKGIEIKRRICGPDLMAAFLSLANEKSYSVFFYGDTDETLEALRQRVTNQFPRVRIAGTYSPPFRPQSKEEQQQGLDIINSSGADVLWVGLGLPRQERWMFDHRNELNVPVVVGVGAAFKFVSGQVARAPATIGNSGFEWLWRLIREPRRVWRRVLIDGPNFVCQVGLELTGLKKFD